MGGAEEELGFGGGLICPQGPPQSGVTFYRGDGSFGVTGAGDVVPWCRRGRFPHLPQNPARLGCHGNVDPPAPSPPCPHHRVCPLVHTGITGDICPRLLGKLRHSWGGSLTVVPPQELPLTVSPGPWGGMGVPGPGGSPLSPSDGSVPPVPASTGLSVSQDVGTWCWVRGQRVPSCPIAHVSPVGYLVWGGRGAAVSPA